MMSSTSWEGIFIAIRNLFYTFIFYILKSTYLSCSGVKKKLCFLDILFRRFQNYVKIGDF